MPKKQIQWEIYRLSSPAAFVGIVYASDEKSGLKAAIKENKITDPEQQKRLSIRRA
jgi:hypothetical protein